ncbi:nuclear factor 7, brain-like isoform X12 [Pimephales promelas]|uniref:nuclear factor 7, brain-like isoform X12 n=1 Tax=Pimephales promelas TaxID=90988 RepID=UPI0019557D95|nr:nuclear factor 7, brain-like isoform X12 [Pimephales promelas]
MLTIIVALLVNLFIETSESFTVVVPRDQTVARVGSTVTLPCWISPPENAEVLEIRWYRQDQFSNPVLLYQNGKTIQEESYRNRSSLTLWSDQSGGLKNGDVSLRLEKLRIQDEGSFHCYVSGESVYDSGEVVLKVIDPPDSSDPWMALFIIAFICVLGLIGFILYKYRLKLTVRDDESMERETKEDEGSSSSCAGAAAPHVHSQPSERKKTIKKICEDETMESLTKVRDNESMERETKEAVKDTNTEEQKKDTVGEQDSSNQEEKPTGLSPDQTSPSADAGSSSWCAGAAAPHVHSQPSESVGDTNIAELRKHAVQITIDPKRSHPGLMVSPDGKTVRDAPDYKHTGEGFPYELCAVGAQRYKSGRRYWEVELALEDKPPKNYWLIGVTKHGNFRMKNRSAVTPSNHSWFLCSDGPNGFYTSSDPKCDPSVSLSLTPRPERLGVLLDYGEGQLSFYNVKERKHVLTMNIRFPGAVDPLFNPGVGDQSSLMILDCPEPVETPVESSEPLLRNSSDA